jgi:nickel/cobalt transporter (NiCoT) family protein
MHALPTEWSALCALVFLLGMRHGFDADHLATIDGLTRLNTLQRKPFARYCGLLFSLGHGAVVMAIAAGVGLASERWDAPAWLDAFGAWLSIAFLLVIAIINLRAVLSTAPDQPVALVGLKGRFLGRLTQAGSPGGVAAVGALFALSFDTVSQSALFAVTAAQFGGLAHALTLGGLFMLGMLATDGLNGWWIAHLIRRADQRAAIASRVMSLAVSGVSLAVAALGIAKQLAPAVESWTEGKELVFGAVVLGVLLGSYLLAKAWAGPRAQPSR